MPEYAVLYTLSLGSEKRHVFEGKIENVPEKAKHSDISEALGSSAYAADFSEHGFFLANRKIVTTEKLPKGCTGTPKVIDWKELSGTATTQMNIRIPGRERAAWELAAKREGIPFRDWLRRTLGDAAGIGDPTGPSADNAQNES